MEIEAKKRLPKAKLEATADVVLLTMENDELYVVLVERKSPPLEGSLALPGGFLWQGETAELAARRVLAAKAGVTRDVYMEQLYTFTDPHRDNRGHILSVSYLALVRREDLEFLDGPQTEKPTLYKVNDHPELSFDHGGILNYGKRRIRDKLAYTNVAFALLPPKFTLSQLQRLYEAARGEELDKRNFRKKYLSLGLIRPTSDTLSGGRHRPAQLYEFVSQKLVELSDPVLK